MSDLLKKIQKVSPEDGDIFIITVEKGSDLVKVRRELSSVLGIIKKKIMFMIRQDNINFIPIEDSEKESLLIHLLNDPKYKEKAKEIIGEVKIDKNNEYQPISKDNSSIMLSMYCVDCKFLRKKLVRAEQVYNGKSLCDDCIRNRL